MDIFDAALKKLKTDGYKLSPDRDMLFKLENPTLVQSLDIGQLLTIKSYNCRFRPTKQDFIINALSNDISVQALKKEIFTTNQIPVAIIDKSIMMGFDVKRTYDKTLLLSGCLDLVIFKKPFLDGIKEFDEKARNATKRVNNDNLSSVVTTSFGHIIAGDVMLYEVFTFDLCIPSTGKMSKRTGKKVYSTLNSKEYKQVKALNSDIIKIEDINPYEYKYNRVPRSFTKLVCKINYKYCLPAKVERIKTSHK